MLVFIYLHFVFAYFLFASAVALADECPNIELIGREEWGAKPPKDVTSMEVPVNYVFIHHTAMGACDNLTSCKERVKEVQDLHMVTNGWWDIGYNFLVGEDGRVYEARGWNKTGAHTRYYNHVAVAVSVMGDFTNRTPNAAALDAVQKIIDCGVNNSYIASNYKLFGHRDVRKTECPGDAFYALIKKWSHYSSDIPKLHIAAVAPRDECSNIDLIDREEWGAKPPKDVTSMEVPVNYVFIHHTAMGECDNLTSCKERVKEVQDLHMVTNGWSDIGYNFLVGEDGRVYEGRGWNRTGAHTKYYNHVAVAVSVMGDFTNRTPNAAALDAVQNIIDCGVNNSYIVSNYKLFGHRDVRKTECPGDAFYALIKKWSHYSSDIPKLHLGKVSNMASMCIASLQLLAIVFLADALIILF